MDIAYGPHGERNLLDLYVPKEFPGPRPLVVCIHGGGWCGGGRDAYRWLVDPLARRGLATAHVTYRFWPRWRCPAAMEDAARAVRFLRANAGRFGLDPDRFGALGGSAGAHLASWLGLAELPDDADASLRGFPARVRCVVDCYGPVDLVAMMDSASKPLVEGFMGKPFDAASEPDYRNASPFHLPLGNPPSFLIVHGTLDVGTEEGQVPLSISERFCGRLKAAGGDATLVKIEGAPHGFSGDSASPHARAMLAAALPFLEKHLGRKT